MCSELSLNAAWSSQSRPAALIDGTMVGTDAKDETRRDASDKEMDRHGSDMETQGAQKKTMDRKRQWINVSVHVSGSYLVRITKSRHDSAHFSVFQHRKTQNRNNSNWFSVKPTESTRVPFQPNNPPSNQITVIRFRFKTAHVWIKYTHS